MQLSELNIWGALLLVLLAVASASLFWLTDRRMLSRMGRALCVGVLQTLLIGAYVWGLMRLDSLWTDLLWLLLMATVVAWLMRGKVSKDKSAKGLALLSASLFVGCGLPALCLSWCLPGRLLVPVGGVLIGWVYLSCTQALGAYLGSLLHTEDHRRYLLANGATRLESLMPSIRRALRAAVNPLLQSMVKPFIVAMPPLFGGLFIGGIDPVTAMTLVLLFIAAALASAVMCAVLSILSHQLMD